MIHKILFGLAVVFGVYQFFRTTDRFSMVILGLQMIGIVLSFITEQPFKMIGSGLFMLTLVLAIIYASIKADRKPWNRGLIIFSAGLALFIHFVPLYHRNDLRILGVGMIIPIAAYIILLARDFKSYKNELGFLTIILVDGVSLFIEALPWLEHL
jgi:hypothetical protein